MIRHLLQRCRPSGKYDPPVEARLRQRGYSLAEVTVAMAVFTILILAALTIYDRSNKVFNQGVQASEMQQSTRVAFDRLVSDIRLAGFDYDRDGIPFGALAPSWTANTSYVIGNLVQPVPANGHTYLCTASGPSDNAQPTWPVSSGESVTESTGVKWQEKGLVQYQQPDEQIEHAGAAALTIRANLDYETETGPCVTAGAAVPCENGREDAIESTQFPLVTTDNDEIVTYALVSNSSHPAANKSTVAFFADTNRPRDVHPGTKKSENEILITDVDTTNLYPPYTLYRYLLDNEGKPVGTPVADNLRSLRFRYYTDTAGTLEITSLPAGGGKYDGGNVDATTPGRDSRASIKSIRVELVGMNPNGDPAYTDGDAAAAHHRKYALTSLVVPRNIGKHGMKEFNTKPPAAPTLKSVCSGACNAVYAAWSAPTSGGDVDSYNVLYDVGNCAGASSCNDCNVSYAFAEDAGNNLAGYATKIIPGQTYRFAAQAINKYGSATSANCISVQVLNTTKPADAVSFTASGGQPIPGQLSFAAMPQGVLLAWKPVTTHAADKQLTNCSDGTAKAEPKVVPGESIRYRIFRRRAPTWKPADTTTETLVLSETSAIQPQLQPTNSGPLLFWMDSTLPMGVCVPYLYRIQAISYPCCGADSMNAGGSKATAIGNLFPDPSKEAREGQAITTSTPAVPTGVGASTIGCIDHKCDVKVSWNAVTTDTSGGPTLIDAYVVSVHDLGDNFQKDCSNPGTMVVDGATSAVLKEMYDFCNYKIIVWAEGCKSGYHSEGIFWPCNWTAGTVNAQPSASYGGGSNYSWIIQYPTTLHVTTGSDVAKVEVAVTVPGSAKPLGGLITLYGPAKSFDVPLPQTPDNVQAQVRLTITTLPPESCKASYIYNVVDLPPPPCALADTSADPAMVKVGMNYVDISLKNLSADTLTPMKMWLTWDKSQSGPAKFANGITSVVFDANGSVPKEGLSAGCFSANVVADVTSAEVTKIAGSQQDYVVRVWFAMQAGKSLEGNPLTNVCVQYRAPYGDIKMCSVVPDAGDCSMPASKCF